MRPPTHQVHTLYMSFCAHSLSNTTALHHMGSSGASVLAVASRMCGGWPSLDAQPGWGRAPPGDTRGPWRFQQGCSGGRISNVLHTFPTSSPLLCSAVFLFCVFVCGASQLSLFTWRNGASERGVGCTHNTTEAFQRGNHAFHNHVLHGSAGAVSGFLEVIPGLVSPSDWVRR